MHAARELDASMSCADGRLLVYTDLGASGSPLVMYFHGAPSSRLDLVLFQDALAALDVRVVSADRPGYGGSSSQAGRGLEDWPADVAALADHLGVERFAVMGASSGGPYAVACAALLPDRVTSAGMVGGELASADRAALVNESLATALMTTMGEAFRQGVRGYAHEGRPR